MNATKKDELDEARDVAWAIWNKRPMPSDSWSAEMAKVFDRWRADGWEPEKERALRR